jgi:hypothetical protein
MNADLLLFSALRRVLTGWTMLSGKGPAQWRRLSRQ